MTGTRLVDLQARRTAVEWQRWYIWEVYAAKAERNLTRLANAATMLARTCRVLAGELPLEVLA